MARIVVVDDSRLARTYTATCLRKLGHQVDEVEPTSVFDVLRALKRHRPELMVMDLLMPDCPGMSLARACHEDPDFGKLRLIVLTAHHDEVITGQLKGLGVAGVLFKPVSPDHLAETVAGLVEA